MVKEVQLGMSMLGLLFILSIASSSALSLHKTPCGFDLECDKSLFLTCGEHTKTCECDKHLIWDKENCRILEGQVCKFPRKHEQSPECISNSTCTYERCQCDDGFLAGRNGACELSYGRECNLKEKCSEKFRLKCSESSTCKCEKEGDETEWDEMMQRCTSLVGSRCDIDSTENDRLVCVANSECVLNEGTGLGHCQCPIGYNTTPEKHCLLDYGQQCDNNEDKVCDKNKHFLCRSGKCGCEFYGQMVYEQDIRECRMLAGEFCDLSHQNHTKGDPYKCISDAECVADPHHKEKGICACVKGKFKADNGTCTSIRGYGLPCYYSGDCDKSKFLTCVLDSDYAAGYCLCDPAQMSYDQETSSCLVNPGKSCAKNPKCGQNSSCDDSEFCHCNQGFSINPADYKCYEIAKSGGNVINTIEIPQDCSIILQHDYARCKCNLSPHIQLWSQTKQKCLGLVGTPCHSDSGCIDYSHCDDEVKTCQCDDSIATTTMNKTCILKQHGQHLSVSSEPRINIRGESYGLNLACKLYFSFFDYLFFLLIILIVQFSM
jgi:hypothetical protein